jgi:hypothetical protein
MGQNQVDQAERRAVLRTGHAASTGSWSRGANLEARTLLDSDERAFCRNSLGSVFSHHRRVLWRATRQRRLRNRLCSTATRSTRHRTRGSESARSPLGGQNLQGQGADDQSIEARRGRELHRGQLCRELASDQNLDLVGCDRCVFLRATPKLERAHRRPNAGPATISELLHEPLRARHVVKKPERL